MIPTHEKQSPIEVSEISSIGFNNGIYVSRDFSLTIKGWDGHGELKEQTLYFDAIEFLRWFDSDAIKTLKEKVINEVKSL